METWIKNRYKGVKRMTENKRFTVIRKKNPVSKEIGNYVQDMGTTILKLGFLEDCKDVCDILNELNDENKQLGKFIMDLQNMIQFDVDNGIKTYPIKLSEYLANGLKEIYND